MARRNWHEVYLLVLAIVFVGASRLTGGEGQVIAATFPAWSQHLWYGGLLVGSVEIAELRNGLVS